MNKLMGFLELNEIGIPAVPWKEYSQGVALDDKLLWTIRCAVNSGDDLNLPRLVGATADKAKEFADSLLRNMRNGIVIYYPYFIAEKSGTLMVSKDKVAIEGVWKDLWNLVSDNKRDVTIVSDGSTVTIGDTNFFKEEELSLLNKYVPYIRRHFKDEIRFGSVLLEWSFARNCDRDKNIIGDNYLVFYEVRTA